ncbi:MAG: flagellar hook protein FlgE [Vulcanimicrobiaceae bacterium]|nr:flagellar hook protein FlgE [Bacillota bacterium]
MAFDSMFTGVSGLDAYQSQIDLISNNIANVGTYGFKGQRMTFADLFYQSQGFASGPTQTSGGINPQDLGLGVKTNSVDTNFAQGGLETTGINTDMAINGDGFFILNNLNGTGSPVYTRDGAFSINANGVLYDPGSGLAVQGYTAGANGTVNSSGTPTTITIPIGLADQATATGGSNAVKLGPPNDKQFDISFGGSLDSTQYTQQQNAPGTGLNKVLTTTIYDSLGNPHQATFVYVPAPPATDGPLPATMNDAAGNSHTLATRYKVEVYFSDGTQVNGAPATQAAPATVGYSFFDANGQFVNTSGTAAGTTVHAQGTPPSAAAGNLLDVTSWNGAALPPTSSNNAAVPDNIGLDLSNMSALSGTSTANVLAQDGYAAGILSNVSIGQDGTVTGAFTNGQQKTLAQIALATFQNEDGLHRLGGNTFSQTVSSGEAQVGAPASGRLGAIISGSLEQSNVSLATEFTKMIVAQRAFEANSRGISTADQNLIDLINLRASEN